MSSKFLIVLSPGNMEDMIYAINFLVLRFWPYYSYLVNQEQLKEKDPSSIFVIVSLLVWVGHAYPEGWCGVAFVLVKISGRGLFQQFLNRTHVGKLRER